MKYIDEFRNKTLIKKAAEKIRQIAPKEKINIMEVCGTHTQSFFRFGLNRLLPENLQLISGPGCPVCVSSQEYIDTAINLTHNKNTTILTFGDMLRVPGSKSNLEQERAKSGNVRVVYSALDALNIARQNPNKKIVFLAVGFETTAPTIALTIVSAKKEKLKNLFFFSALKLIPPAMGYLLKDKRAKVSGFLCPGHVSSIIGTRPYEFIPKRHGIGCCVAGFEPLDILEGIYILLRQINEHRPRVENQYMRVVNRRGNLSAQKIIFQVFEKTETSWRGLGRIPKSGLRIKEEFSQFDSEKVLLDARRLAHGRRRTTHDARHTTQDTRYKTQCKCADVLKGIISPLDCPLFSKVCSPNNPKGPCMVSSEGACNAYYKYR